MHIHFVITGVRDAIVYIPFLMKDGLKAVRQKNHPSLPLSYNTKIIDTDAVIISLHKAN